MTLENALKLILVGASLCFGAYLTGLRAKITSNKIKNRLHFVFYGLTTLFFVGPILALIVYWDELFYSQSEFKPNFFGLTTIFLCAVASCLLFFFTKKNLVGKYQYRTKELTPIVNAFTEKADRNRIRLLAGDINFFGNSPIEMESNLQYTFLREANFGEIQILCWKPTTNNAKIRYGKILNDMPKVNFRYYQPSSADLLIRGRLKTFNNVTQMLIYNKVDSGIYEALVTDTANSNGAMYNALWTLIWDLAEVPQQTDLNNYMELFRN